MEHVEDAQFDGIDPNASPYESVDSNTTPDTEFSPPSSPFSKASVPKNHRLLARQKLAQLSLEEKVYGERKSMLSDC